MHPNGRNKLRLGNYWYEAPHRLHQALQTRLYIPLIREEGEDQYNLGGETTSKPQYLHHVRQGLKQNIGSDLQLCQYRTFVVGISS